MANALGWRDAIRGEGVVREPFARSRSAVVDEADVGAVAAAALTGDGHSEELIDLLASWQGDPPPEAYTVVDTVERVTGRPPRSFEHWASEHAAAFG